MSDRLFGLLCRAALLLGASISLAHAHHVMDYALPATALDGFLSGLGHPVIGVDHLLFITGAGVLAAPLRRGFLLPLVFVAVSMIAAAARAGGLDWGMAEIWIALSLIALGALMLVARDPKRSWIAALFFVSGAFHGYALAQSIIGAERTPLLAYFIGLTVVQCAIALSAWTAARWLAAQRPQLPLRQIVGAAMGAAGLLFVGLAAL